MGPQKYEKGYYEMVKVSILFLYLRKILKKRPYFLGASVVLG